MEGRLNCRCGDGHRVHRDVDRIKCDCGAMYAITVTEIRGSQYPDSDDAHPE